MKPIYILPRHVIHAIIFDKDGVFSDTEPIKAKSWDYALTEQGHQGGAEWYRARIGTSGEVLAREVAKDFNLTQDQVEVLYQRKKEFYISACASEVLPIKNTIDFINSIPIGLYSLAVASSDYRESIESQLEKFGIRDRMDAIVSGKEVRRDKPDPEIYLETARKLRIKPSNCLAIEDTVIGARAANAAGMLVIGFQHVNSGSQDFGRYVEYVTDDLRELKIET